MTQHTVHGWRWGVPDWRDTAAYSRAENTRLGRWRWEFLRRRQDYREDWRLHFERAYRRNVAVYGALPCPEGVRSWEEHFAHFANAPEIGMLYGTGSLLIDPAQSEYAFNLFRQS